MMGHFLRLTYYFCVTIYRVAQKQVDTWSNKWLLDHPVYFNPCFCFNDCYYLLSCYDKVITIRN